VDNISVLIRVIPRWSR